MQGKININFVVKEYQEKMGELTNELIVLQAYIKQLEQELVEVKALNENSNEN